MKKRWLTILVVLLVLIISGIAFGHMRGDKANRAMMGRGMMGSGMMMGRGMMDCDMMMQGYSGCPMMTGFVKGTSFYLSYSEELRLSDEQVRSLKSIRDSYEKDVITTTANLHTVTLELDNLLHEDEVELSKAKALNKKIETLQTEIRFKNIEAFVKAKRTLNKEQLKQLRDLELCGKDSPCGMMHR